MQNNLAVLIALAERPEGRATLDELEEEIPRLIAKAGEKMSALDHIDIFRSQLVASEGRDSLRITESGRSLLHALGGSAQELPDLDPASTPQSLGLIDDLIGTEARQKIFDLGLRSSDPGTNLMPSHASPSHEKTTEVEEASAIDMPAGGELPDGIDDRSNDRPAEADQPPAETRNEAASPRRDGEIVLDPPAFLNPQFGSGLRTASSGSGPWRRLTRWTRRAIGAWRSHLEQDQPLKEDQRPGTNIGRLLFVLLSLLAMASCAGAVAALMQVKSLKSELAAMQRELLPLKERIARLDLIERTREIPEKASRPPIPPPRENRPEEGPLVLSREEIQLIRDYIKPAPVVGASTTPINVGDPITVPTIGFPSPVTEKVPKLLGARFVIRNGAIVIVRKDSRQADAVLGPN